MKSPYLKLALYLGAACSLLAQERTPLSEGVSLLARRAQPEGAGMLLLAPRAEDNVSAVLSLASGILSAVGQPLVISGSLQLAENSQNFRLEGSSPDFQAGTPSLLVTGGGAVSGTASLRLGEFKEVRDLNGTPLPPLELRPLPGEPIVLTGTLTLAGSALETALRDTMTLVRPLVPPTGEQDGIIRLDPREWDGTFNGATGSNPPRVVLEPPKPAGESLAGETAPTVGGQPPSRNDSQSPGMTKLLAGEYRLSAVVPKLQAGVPVDTLSMITVLRPSPGDDYWYRLPHTISVQGTLPEGVELVQKGVGFHELAHFKGTPSRAGTYQIILQATMDDGAKTAPFPITLEVSEPGGFSYVGMFSWGRTRFVAGESVDGGSSLTLVTDRGVLPNAADETVYAFEVSGLPEGLRYEAPRGDGNFVLVGNATEPGTYKVRVQWGPKGGESLARTDVELEILPADYVPAKRVVIHSAHRPLKQASQYEAGTFDAPVFFVEDELGRRLETGFTLEAEGLPRGLVMNDRRVGALSGLTGRPGESGTFAIRVKARFEDGSESEPVEYALQVEPSLNLADAAGTYDCLLERSEQFNESNGGRCVVTMNKTGALSGYFLHNFKRYSFTSRNVQLEKESGLMTISPPNSGLVFTGGIQEDTQGYSSPERRVYVLSGTLASQTNPEIFTSLRGMGATAPEKGRSSVFASPHPINLMVVKGTPFEKIEPEESGPTGIGFSALRISPTGMVTATVWAADGSAPVSFATRLCETADLGARFTTFFALNNSSGRSALMGALFVNAQGDAAGQMDWYQNASDRGGFPNGIPHLQYQGVIGSRLVPQASGLNLEGFEAGLRNAELDFTGADGVTEDVIPLTLNSKSIQPALPSGAPSADMGPVASAVRIRYNAGMGVLNGSMVWTDPATGARRPVNFRGMRAPDGASFMGHFTAPETAGSKKLEAGQIRIQPSQQVP